MPCLILMYGPSGTGKTILARRLAKDLSLPFVNKDSIKEMLFETLGPGDADWSSKLSRASIRLLCHHIDSILAAGCSCIGEANFDTTAIRPIFIEMQQRHAFSSVEILCRADSQIRLDRLRHRHTTGQRHPAHGNTEADITREWQDLEKRLTPIGLDGLCMDLDTTDFPESPYLDLLAKIRAFSSTRQSGLG